MTILVFILCVFEACFKYILINIKSINFTTVNAKSNTPISTKTNVTASDIIVSHTIIKLPQQIGEQKHKTIKNTITL